MADIAPPMLRFVASIPPQTLIGIHSRFPIAQASQRCLLPSADTPSWNSRWGANRRASSVQLNLIELNSAEHVFSESESHSVVSNSLRPMDYTVHGILQARILEWVAFPSSSGSFQPRDWTRVSCIAGRFFTNWATSEACVYWSHNTNHINVVIYINELGSRLGIERN